MSKRLIKLRTCVAAVVLALFATAAGAAVLAPAASADVLVNYDGGTIHVGQFMHPGVWYQSFSGGPRRYWAGVYNPNGRLIWERRGRASASHFKEWRVEAQKSGNYRTLYVTDGTRTNFITKVKARG